MGFNTYSFNAIYRQYALNSEYIKNNRLNFVFITLLGFWAGFGGENISSAMIFAMVLFTIYYKINNIKIPYWVFGSIISSLISFIIMISAPAYSVRTTMEESIIKLSIPFKFAMITYFAVAFLSLLTIIFIFSFWIAKKYSTGNYKKLFLQCIIFIVSGIASAYSMIMATTSPQRTWFCSILFFIIAIGICINEVDNKETEYKCIVNPISFKVLLATVSIVYFTVMYLDTCLSTYEILSQTKMREANIIEQREKGNMDIEVVQITHKYPLLSNHDALYNLADISEELFY